MIKNWSLFSSEGFDDAGHLVGNANLLGAFLQAFFAVGTLVSPFGSIGQCFAQTFGKLLLTRHVIG